MALLSLLKCDHSLLSRVDLIHLVRVHQLKVGLVVTVRLVRYRYLQVSPLCSFWHPDSERRLCFDLKIGFAFQ